VADRLPTSGPATPGTTGWGVDETVFPAEAASFVESERLPGELLNHFDNGGYLLYRLHPPRRVLVSSDTSLYPPSWFREIHREVLGRDAHVETLPERYGVRTAVLSHASAETELLLPKLARSAAWTLVFADEAAAVFVHDDGRSPPSRAPLDLDRNYPALARAALAERSPQPAWLGARPRVEPATRVVRFLRLVGRPDLATRLGLERWEAGPDVRLAREIALAAEPAGAAERSVPVLEWAARESPSPEIGGRLTRALYLRGLSALERGDFGTAEADLQAASARAPREPGPLAALAKLEAMRGNDAAARDLVRRALAATDAERGRRALAHDEILRPLLDE
jgi:hypothetical protein